MKPSHRSLLKVASATFAVKWDPPKVKVHCDLEAEKLLKTLEHRNPWKLN